MSEDPMYSPTREEIDEQCRAVRRKFSNRFVPIDEHQSVLERARACHRSHVLWRTSKPTSKPDAVEGEPCKHERLDIDGWCFTCGEDCRGAH